MVPQLALDLDVQSPLWARLPEAEAIVRRAAAALVAAGPEAGVLKARDEVCMVLGDDELARRLNGRWLRKDAPTNVLSFPSAFPDTGDGGRLLGDIVLAFETIEREAKESGTSLEDHVAHLAVHGILHLLGHDHVADAGAAVMEALETRILKSLGIADPYTAQAA